MRTQVALAAMATAVLLACRGDAKPPQKADPIVKRWTTITERASAPPMTLYGLQSDGAALYWVSCPGLGAPCALVRLAHDATTPTQLVAAPGLRAYALDATDVYVSANRRLLRVPKTGGAPAVVSEDQPAWDLKVTGDMLYVGVADTRKMTGPDPNPTAGQIVRIPKAGGAAVTLASHTASMPRLAIDDRRIYVTGDDAILAIPREGGDVEQIARDDRHPPSSIALDDDAIYYSAGGEVRRVAKAGGPVTVVTSGQIILSVRVSQGAVFATRNVAYDRGQIAEPAAILRIAHGTTDVVAELPDSPQGLAVDGGGVYVLRVGIGAGLQRVLDRVVAYPR